MSVLQKWAFSFPVLLFYWCTVRPFFASLTFLGWTGTLFGWRCSMRPRSTTPRSCWRRSCGGCPEWAGSWPCPGIILELLKAFLSRYEIYVSFFMQHLFIWNNLIDMFFKRTFVYKRPTYTSKISKTGLDHGHARYYPRASEGFPLKMLNLCTTAYSGGGVIPPLSLSLKW